MYDAQNNVSGSLAYEYDVTNKLTKITEKDSVGALVKTYEYEYDKLPIDLIIGDRAVRERLENQEAIAEITASWGPDLETYRIVREQFLLYKG